jgi:hypothetical protein
MIDLHERLSEFSYGYGITREVEQLLLSVGIRTVPFMPSLLQEQEIGFDVGFQSRGIPLLLQFKLGHSLQRFIRSDKRYAAPKLDKPYFRFSIDTAEPDGQFETLLKAETDGAETYYVAPRFSDWPRYINYFEAGEVLGRSVMVTPREIRAALVSKGSPDGAHRIVYDRDSVHVCSKPTSIRDVRPERLAENVVNRVHNEDINLGQALRRVYGGLEYRSMIRRSQPSQEKVESDETTLVAAHTLDQRASPQNIQLDRSRRLIQFRERSRSEEDALAAALGLEFWGLGIQLLFAFRSKSDV